MLTYEFTVPLPPSDNCLYVNNPGKGRGRFKSKEATRYAEEVRWLMMKARIPRRQLRARWKVQFICEMDRKTFAKRDLSNCFKCLLDAMAAHMETDDRFLLSMEATKTYLTDRNKMVVKLEVLTEEEWLSINPTYYKKISSKSI